MSPRAVLLAGLAVFVLTDAPEASQDAEKRRYRATKIEEAPDIDGRLDDRCWSAGSWESGFTQWEPHEGRPPSEETAFQVVYDERNLYVAVRAFDREPERIERRVTRRDDRQGDQVEIALDTYFDHQTAFAFNVNSAGVKSDFVISSDGDVVDESWDAVWHAQVAQTSEGWIAEIAIPFSQLRFGKGQRIWGAQVRRRIHRHEETSDWQFIPKDAPGLVHRFGELYGLDEVPARRQFELLPYSLARMERFESEEGNPFATGSASAAEVGLDGKIAATSDVTLTFTVNPDFGQVEADPSEVNLTTFETFFQEKRPFFIEGANILDFRLMGGDGGFSADNLFYSRRIGRAPQIDPDTGDEEHLDVPERATILGAFKLTGKTRNGWSLGLLESVTSREDAAIDLAGARRRELVEPRTNYFLARVQKDFDEGSTVLGGMITATNREGTGADVGRLHRAAYSGGVDFRHSFLERTYYVDLNGTFSSVRGEAATLLRTQESSRRYFQRPDADYVEVDPTRASLSGHGGTVEVGKEGGGHLRFSLGTTWRSPGLELNDVGFLRTADQILQWSFLGWRIWEPFSIFRTFNVNANQWRAWDFGGTNLFDGGNVNAHMQFRNYWSLGLGVNRESESISNQELRGGPSLRLPGGWGNWLNVRSDSRRKVQFNVGGWRYEGDDGADRAHNLWIGNTLRPSDGVSISLEPFLLRIRKALQYVETAAAGSDERFVLGSLDQTTFGITLRLNYSVTPDLSVQLYGQPFLSTGGYSDFKRITRPRAASFFDRFDLYTPEQIAYDGASDKYLVNEGRGGASYGFGNPDFDFRQLRSNLVVRWEYTPGSTLFVVWSQDRTGEDPTGEFSLREGLRELYRIHPHNVFLVKLSYRFSL